jgi:tetratricopeptide (TPR) repeat protein
MRPDSAVILDAVGRAELQSGRYRSAKYYLEQASRLNPGSDFTAINLAQACLHLGEYATAEQLVRRAVGHSPDNANAWRLLGQILCQNRRYGDAKAAFRRSLAIRDDPWVWNDLAVLHQKEGQKTQALELLQRAALGMAPGQARARVRANLGLLQWRMGARAEGAASLRGALEEMTTAVGSNHPDTGWILESYAEVLRKAGRKAESKIARDRATEIRTAFSFQNNRNGMTVDRAEVSPAGIGHH